MHIFLLLACITLSTSCVFHDIDSIRLGTEQPGDAAQQATDGGPPDEGGATDTGGSATPDASAADSAGSDLGCIPRTDNELCAQGQFDCVTSVTDCGVIRELDCGACGADTFCIAGFCACTDTLVCAEKETCDPVAASCECNGVVRVGSPICVAPYLKCGKDVCECKGGSCLAGFACAAKECNCDSDADCGFGTCSRGQCDCASDGVLCEFGARCSSAASADCTCDGASCRPVGS